MKVKRLYQDHKLQVAFERIMGGLLLRLVKHPGMKWFELFFFGA